MKEVPAGAASDGPEAPPEADPVPRPKVEARRSAPKAKEPAVDPLADFPCHLGDVVMIHGVDEAWLAGALVFYEKVPAAALFFAPEAGGDRALFVRPKPSSSIVWLSPLADDEVTVGPEPPSTLEHKGDRFERLRRLPLRVERVGTGAPDVGDQALVVEYASGGERLLVLVAAGKPRGYRGHVLEEGTYDLLPGTPD
jgi:hypothetical protein